MDIKTKTLKNKILVSYLCALFDSMPDKERLLKIDESLSEAIDLALQKRNEEVVEKLPKIKYKWILKTLEKDFKPLYNGDKYEEQLVCNICGMDKDDPELEHYCDEKNDILDEVKNIIKGI